MKFIHLSDLHLGKRVNGYSMLEDQEYILNEIKAVITAEAPDAVLIAGDVYDKPVPPAEAVRLFILGRFRSGCRCSLPAVLRRVEMSESNIIKRCEYGSVDVVGTADGDLFGFGADGSGHKLMGDQNVPVCVIQRQMRERGLHGIGVGLDLLRFRFIKTADMRGFDERQHINVDNPVCIVQRNRRHRTVVNRRQIDSACIHQTGAESDPFRGVMISTDHKYFESQSGEQIGRAHV